MISAPSPAYVVHRGELRRADDALLAPDDGLALHGRGAFETLAAYRGRPFLPEAHLERLRRAASVLDLPCPGDDILLEAMETALRANRLAELPKARLRLTLSSPPDNRSFWWVAATAPPPHPDRARLVTGPFVRNERGLLSGLKTTHCADNLVALQRARAAGADEALFLNTRNELCEGAWSNLFVKIGGRWRTPPLGSGCLPGITRRLVLDLASTLSIPISEEPVPLGDLDRIEAAFLTSSLREIQAVAALDDRPLDLPPEIGEWARAYRERTSPA